MTDPVACIGWLADPRCPVHGVTHGCRWPEGHTGRRHECICGATCRRQVERVSVLDQRGRSVK